MQKNSPVYWQAYVHAPDARVVPISTVNYWASRMPAIRGDFVAAFHNIAFSRPAPRIIVCVIVNGMRCEDGVISGTLDMIHGQVDRPCPSLAHMRSVPRSIVLSKVGDVQIRPMMQPSHGLSPHQKFPKRDKNPQKNYPLPRCPLIPSS